ncbi:MAG: alpha-L-arabinofuranosidase C-terminal domain-containing protein [Planctomycetota bacterium]|jgi:alpha-N-arabinofuranosidase
MFRVRFVWVGVLGILIAACISTAAVAEEQKPAQKATVTVAADKTGEPISRYIYGQFIEHLGRCIYGGIWAEMLEDRKFYFPITAEYDPYGYSRGKAKDVLFPVVGASPWQVLGDADGVKMAREDSFVGDRTPLITPGSGIRQNDLGLVKNKQYIGYIWLKPANGTTTVEVSLRWGEGLEQMERETITNGTNRYQKCPLRFTAGAGTGKGMLEVKVTGGGPCFVGTVSLMPADNINGMRADTLKVLKELDAPLYRWPGGNFVSGYDWRDGTGDRDKRPPRKNPAWTGVEHNDFGLDEFVAFCREVGAEPLIVVNSGFGDDHSAAEEVEYANGAADTPMGGRRAANGHKEPYNVKWWGIGNEMYGDWQLGYMALKHYVQKHNLFARAMRAVDPSIKLVAVGDVRRWSEGMLKNCADYMDLISEHFYKREKQPVTKHVRQIIDAVRGKVEAHHKWRNELESLKGRDIRISLDEWNYWYGPHIYGELGTRYFLQDALGIGAGLNEMIRNSDMIFMANYAQTVNVIGCIKTTKTEAAFATTGLALKLYRRRFGTLPVEVASNGGPLDVAAAWATDRRALTIAVVNPTTDRYEIAMELEGARLTGTGRLWQIAGSDPKAYNEPGKEPNVVIEEKKLPGISNELSVEPLSISLFELPAR